MEPFSPSRRAGLGTRLLARIIDGLILFIPTLILTVPIAGGFNLGTGNVTGRTFLAGIVSVGLSFGYHVYFESNQGATPGKKVVKLTIVSPDGTPPTPSEAAKRNAWMLLAAVPTGLGGLLSLGAAIGIAITANGDDAGRGFHDRYAGLQVATTAPATA